MSEDVVEYDLKGRLFYARRDTLPTLLLSLGRYLNRLDKRGWTGENISIYPSGDGDWVATILVQHTNHRPPDELAVLSAADLSLSAEVMATVHLQADAEAARLRRIEAFRKQDAERFKKGAVE